MPEAPQANQEMNFIPNPLALIMPSWRALWCNVKAWLIMLAIVAVPALLAGLMLYGLKGEMALMGPIAVAGIAILSLFFIRLLPMAIALELSGAKGQKLSFRESYEATKGKTLRMFILLFYVGVITLLGMILLIIPGVLIATWYAMAPYAMIEENLGIKDSLNRSKDLAKGRFFDIAGVVFFTSAVSILGLIPAVGFVPVIVLTIMYLAAPAIRYLQTKAYKDAGKELPPVHWLNYLILILGIIGSLLSYRADMNKPGIESPNPFSNIR